MSTATDPCSLFDRQIGGHRYMATLCPDGPDRPNREISPAYYVEIGAPGKRRLQRVPREDWIALLQAERSLDTEYIGTQIGRLEFTP